MSGQALITEHLDLWTGAVKKKSSSGRGSNGKVELTGVKKLRELILELAVRGMLVTQDKADEPVSLLLKKIELEESAQLKAKTIRKPKQLSEVQDLEQPFPIPDSWRYCRLNELGIWGSGATPKRGNASYYGGGIPWFKSGELYKDFIDSSEETITELAVQETSVRMNQPGDVLIAMYGATIGKASILKVAGTTNQAVCACTPWTGISNRFLLLLLKAYRSRFIAMGAGGAQPNISREKIIATVIGLPPEQEQHRIVQKVDELMALCDHLEQQTSDQLEAHEILVDTLLGTLTQSKNATELADNWARLAAHFDTLFTTEQSIDKLKQTILQLAFSGRLIEQNAIDENANNLMTRVASGKEITLKHGSKTMPKYLPPVDRASEPFDLPEQWKWVKMGHIFEITSSKRIHARDYVSSGVPFFRSKEIGELQAGRPITTDLFIPTEKYEELSNQSGFPEGGDLMLTSVGTIGNTWICDGRRFYYKDGNITKISKTPFYDARLLQHFIESPIFRSAVTDTVSGTAYNALTIVKLKSLLIPLIPLNEQTRILQKINELTALCNQLKQRLNQASATRRQLAEALVEGALS